MLTVIPLSTWVRTLQDRALPILRTPGHEARMTARSLEAISTALQNGDWPMAKARCRTLTVLLDRLLAADSPCAIRGPRAPRREHTGCRLPTPDADPNAFGDEMLPCS